MANVLYFGGVGKVVIDAVGGDFTTAPDIEITQFAEEGNTWPVPEAITAGVHGGQQGPTGERTPFSFNALNVDAATVATIRSAGYALTRKDVQFTSKDGKTKMVVAKCLLRIVTAGIAEHGQYGFVTFAGEGVASGAGASNTITHTP
jgi:hypothetical protein